ncbi:1,2-phenylacetyl-CoA epoxidase subunit PaaC [Shouchella shacheensis]|uniref:1,2-phenylacetyl-CoA epoxidase subunit PaaC n=1 Tax=Shouchella shacheensis TaxID=1649580 RepID=UPI00074040AF|nr:1,2-phenylacetyl-CoA epoxidase subunit PaaC [Shouchella shacheensis]
MNEEKSTTQTEHQEAIISLLLQLADDDFIFSFRGSEWLGLAPHIEEDVASASISQDMMGHAAMFYKLAEGLGLDAADELAHGRAAGERRNSILVERVNGEGSYMGTPTYDWAYAVVRNYFYSQAKKVKIDSLKTSAYAPLAEVATKVNMELYYHLLHWKTWFTQLLSSTDEAKEKMNDAIQAVMADFGDVFSYGEDASRIQEAGLIEEEGVLYQRWVEKMEPVLQSVGVSSEQLSVACTQNGRNKEHTTELESAIATLSEVYRSDLTASW